MNYLKKNTSVFLLQQGRIITFACVKNHEVMSVYTLVRLLALFSIFPAHLMGQSAPIALDGTFGDWTSDLATVSEAPNAPSGVDLLEAQVSNDEHFLFIRLKADDEFDLMEPLIPQDIRLYLDTDHDESTGHPIQSGFGAELSISFSTRSAKYFRDATVNVELSDISFRTSPTVTSEEFELAIRRDALPDGEHPLFPSASIKVLLHNKLNQDTLPSEGLEFSYTFDERPVPAPQPVDLVKTDGSHIRMLAYNTKNDGLKDPELVPHFENILKVLNPDIIGFSECYNTDPGYVKGLLDSWLPRETEEGWHVASGSGGDLITASTWPILETEDVLPRQMPALIDLPEAYSSDLLFTNAHLNCCAADDKRQDQVDAYISALLFAKDEGEEGGLPEGTPFVYAGDLNLVGYAQQLTTLLTGDIQNTSKYGPGGKPDWDGTDLTDLISMQTDVRMDYTWRSDFSSYPPGKLDYVIYSDAVLTAEKHFVLRTESMSAERLAQYGLNQLATSSASDHFPVVADFSLVSQTGTRDPMPASYTLYPNPVSQTLMISGKMRESSCLRIVNSTGIVVYEETLEAVSLTIDVSRWTNGMYVLSLIREDGSREDHTFIKH